VPEFDPDPTLRTFFLMVGLALPFGTFGGDPVFEEGGFLEDVLQLAEGLRGGDANGFVNGWKGVSVGNGGDGV